MKFSSQDMPSQLILASKSPRRNYLLKQAGLNFRVIPAEFDEHSVAISPPEQYVRVLAEEKARMVAEEYPASWVIGADTIVLADGRIMGKPESKAAAREMLTKLSGRTHQVLTGYAITRISANYHFSETIVTKVMFKTLTETEIEWYINTDEPFDKAGAYAIQGLGSFLVKRIEGSYTNVVGLPVCEVIEHLIRLGAVSLTVNSANY